jgi:hypothetical protein
MTPLCYKKAMEEGVKIIERVNEEVGSKRKLFLILGNPYDVQVKSFWVKVQCTYCSDFFHLCPPKKIL